MRNEEMIMFHGQIVEPNYLYRRSDGDKVLCHVKQTDDGLHLKVKTAKSNYFCLPIYTDKLTIIQKTEKKKETKMENSKTHAIAIVLMENKYQSVTVKLDSSGKEYTYIAERSMELQEKDKVLVPGKPYGHGKLSNLLKDNHPEVSVGVVTSVSDDIDIDIDIDNIKYSTILGKFDVGSAERFLTKLNKIDTKVKKAIRAEKIQSVLRNIKI